jgi:hypothetical protein
VPRVLPLIEDTSTNGTWKNFQKLVKDQPTPLRSGDLVKLVNPAPTKDQPEAECPEHLFFTFYDLRPMAFIAFRLRLCRVHAALPDGAEALASEHADEERAPEGRVSTDVDWHDGGSGKLYHELFDEERALGEGSYGVVWYTEEPNVTRERALHSQQKRPTDISHERHQSSELSRQRAPQSHSIFNSNKQYQRALDNHQNRLTKKSGCAQLGEAQDIGGQGRCQENGLAQAADAEAECE